LVLQHPKKSSESSDIFPIKWSSPEILDKKEFSFASDVFAFAITMIEIFTCGKVPYPDMKNDQVMEKVKEGYRMSKPKECPENVFKLMERCWNQNPKERPTFEEISKELQVILKEASDEKKKEIREGELVGSNAISEGNDYIGDKKSKE